MLKEIVENIVNEGTQAVAIVKTGEGKYSMSYIQYDGGVGSTGRELKKNFSSDKLALKVVDKTGEIAGISNGEVEYYKNKKMLVKDVDERAVVKKANTFGSVKYLWNGERWSFSQTSMIRDLLDVNKAI